MKYKGKELVKRIFILIVALMIQTMGIALFLKASLGLAPIAVFVNAVSTVAGVSFGTVSLTTGIIFLVIVLLWDRKYVSIGTFIATFFFGPMVDGMLYIASQLGINPQGLGEQILWFFIAYIITCLGLGLLISARMGIASIEAVLLTAAYKMDKPFKWIKVAGDFIFFAVGFIILLPPLASIIGTVFVVFAFGPGASLALRFWDKVNLKVFGLQGEYIK